MNTSHRLVALSLVAAGALLVAACGDDSTQQPGSPVSTDVQMTESTEAMMTESTEAMMTESTEAMMPESTEAMMTESTEAMMTETTGG